jgi:hypothetical protein
MESCPELTDWKIDKPWQDRRTLFCFARTPREAASRRLAHGFPSSG